MTWIFFIAAFCVFLYLKGRYTVDNSVRARIGRVIDAVPDFTTKYRVADGYNQRVLALDPSSRRMVFVGTGYPVRVISFDDLVAVEIERNGTTIEKTHRSSQALGAAVGAALLGPAGFVVGGLSGKKSQTASTTRLLLRLTVQDLDDPLIELVFLDTAKVEVMPPHTPCKTSPEDRLQEWYGRLRVILHEREHGGNGSPSAATRQPSPSPLEPLAFGRRRGRIAQG